MNFNYQARIKELVQEKHINFKPQKQSILGNKVEQAKKDIYDYKYPKTVKTKEEMRKRLKMVFSLNNLAESAVGSSQRKYQLQFQDPTFKERLMRGLVKKISQSDVLIQQKYFKFHFQSLERFQIQKTPKETTTQPQSPLKYNSIASQFSQFGPARSLSAITAKTYFKNSVKDGQNVKKCEIGANVIETKKIVEKTHKKVFKTLYLTVQNHRHKLTLKFRDSNQEIFNHLSEINTLQIQKFNKYQLKRYETAINNESVDEKDDDQQQYGTIFTLPQSITTSHSKQQSLTENKILEFQIFKDQQEGSQKTSPSKKIYVARDKQKGRTLLQTLKFQEKKKEERLEYLQNPLFLYFSAIAQSSKQIFTQGDYNQVLKLLSNKWISISEKKVENVQINKKKVAKRYQFQKQQIDNNSLQKEEKIIRQRRLKHKLKSYLSRAYRLNLKGDEILEYMRKHSHRQFDQTTAFEFISNLCSFNFQECDKLLALDPYLLHELNYVEYSLIQIVLDRRHGVAHHPEKRKSEISGICAKEES